MQRLDDGSTRAFELGENGWAPLGATHQSAPPRAAGDALKQLAETRAQLLVLRGLYDALLARVVALETSNVGLRRSLPPSLGRRVPSRRSVFDGLKSSPVSRDRPATPVALSAEPMPGVGPSFAPAPPPAAAIEYAAASVETAAANQTLASARPALLALPSSADVVSCLQMLAADVPVTQYRADAPASLADYYAAFLSDDAGEAIGALLFNLRASAELGGGILGVAAAEREQQATLGLTADSLDGLNEVANNLTGVLNRANPKRLVRMSPIERAPASPPPWLASPHKKLAFSTRAGGTLFLLVL